MKKIYIKPDMFPMGQEPEIIYEDEIGTFYYDEKEDMKQCDVCDQHFKNDAVTKGKDGFTICKWCLEFEDGEFMPEHIVDGYDLDDEAKGQR